MPTFVPSAAEIAAGIGSTPATISAGNSTTVALTGAATFTGDWVDSTAFATMVVTGAANVGGQLFIDLSDDGVTVRQHIPMSAVDATSFLHTIAPGNAYARVVYVNGASAQSSFWLQTKFHPGVLLIRNRAAATLTDYSDVLPVRIVTDPILDEATGRHTGRDTVYKFGSNANVASATEEDIWNAGGIYSGWLTAASAVRIRSGGNTNDTAAGTGARSVTIVGLDENFVEAEETVATAGSSASSATTTTFIRVFRAYVATTGTYTGRNTGNILIETTGGTLMAQIGLDRGGNGLGQTQLALYTVPAGKVAYIRRVAANVEGAKAADVFFYRRESADTVSAPYVGRRTFYTFLGLTGAAESMLSSYIGPIGPKADIWVAAVGPSGGASVSAGFDLVLVAE